MSDERNEREATLEVAKTIYQQLGGARFAFMTGARQFVGAAFEGLGSLRFRIRHRIVVIRLTAADDYTITLYTARSNRIVAEQDQVYCDQLVEVFEHLTGLRASL